MPICRKINKYITAFSKTLVFVVLYAHKDNFFFCFKMAFIIALRPHFLWNSFGCSCFGQ